MYTYVSSAFSSSSLNNKNSLVFLSAPLSLSFPSPKPLFLSPVCLFVSVSPSLCVSRSVSLCLFLSLCVFASLPACLSVCLSPSVCLFLFLPTHSLSLSLRLTVHLFLFRCFFLALFGILVCYSFVGFSFCGGSGFCFVSCSGLIACVCVCVCVSFLFQMLHTKFLGTQNRKFNFAYCLVSFCILGSLKTTCFPLNPFLSCFRLVIECDGEQYLTQLFFFIFYPLGYIYILLFELSFFLVSSSSF